MLRSQPHSFQSDQINTYYVIRITFDETYTMITAVFPAQATDFFWRSPERLIGPFACRAVIALSAWGATL
jgi:hypothetical protein